jgi:hypothetical protein
MMQQPALLSPKFRGKVFAAHFHAISVKHHSSMQNCLACQDEFFVNNPLDVKIMTMLLTLLFTCLTFLGLDEFGLLVYGSCFLPRTLV